MGPFGDIGGSIGAVAASVAAKVPTAPTSAGPVLPKPGEIYHEDLIALHRGLNVSARQRLKAFDRRWAERSASTGSGPGLSLLGSLHRPEAKSGRHRGDEAPGTVEEPVSFLKGFATALFREGDVADARSGRHGDDDATGVEGFDGGHFSIDMQPGAGLADGGEHDGDGESEGFSSGDDDELTDQFLWSSVASLPTAHLENGLSALQRPIKVVACSSERMPYRAENLVNSGATWEALKTGGEYVVFQLVDERPACVAGIGFSLPGDNTGPRDCSVHFSKESPTGPWAHAWDFSVDSRGQLMQTASTSYEGRHLASSFRKLCEEVSPHGTKETWRKVLGGGDGDSGGIDLQGFSSGCMRLRDLCESSGLFRGREDIDLEATLEHPRKVFMGLDVLGSGKVTLEDLLEDRERWPEAQWWKMTVKTNFGSTKRLQVVGPLEAFVLPAKATLGDLRSPGGHSHSISTGSFKRNVSGGSASSFLRSVSGSSAGRIDFLSVAAAAAVATDSADPGGGTMTLPIGRRTSNLSRAATTPFPSESISSARGGMDSGNFTVELSEDTIVTRRLSDKLHMQLSDIEVLQGMFSTASKAVPGELTEEEFKGVVRRMTSAEEGDLSEAQLLSMWRMADLDGSGSVDFEELVSWTKKYGGELRCRSGNFRRARLTFLN